jgi:hypothetical protein
MPGTVGAARTLVLPLWGPNGVKNAALDATEALFTQVVRFYVHVLLVQPSPWARVPKRDKHTGAVVADSAHRRDPDAPSHRPRGADGSRGDHRGHQGPSQPGA